MRRQFDVEIAFGTFSVVVVVGAAAAAAPSPYRTLSGRNVVDTTSTPECITRSSFRRSEAQNVSKEETNILLMLGLLRLSSNHPLCSPCFFKEVFSAFADVSKRDESAQQRMCFKEKRWMTRDAIIRARFSYSSPAFCVEQHRNDFESSARVLRLS